MKLVSVRAIALAWVLSVPGGAPAWAQETLKPTNDAPLPAAAAVWPPLGAVAVAPQVESAAEEISLRLSQTASTDGEPIAQGPSVPAFEPGPVAAPTEKSAAPDELAPPSPALPLPPAATSPGKPSPAAKACLFAAASTLPLVPDAKISSASAAPIGSMAGDGLYRDFRVILIVDALGMTTTVEFSCRSADTPEIFGAEILSARILE